MSKFILNITCIYLIVHLGIAESYAVERQNLLDWYYSAAFGTGSYRIGERDVFAVQVPYRTEIRPATDKKYAIFLDASLTAGFYDYNFDKALELEVPSDVATLSIFPGIYYFIPLSGQWTIKPFLNIGYGKEFEGGEEAVIYSSGISSLYSFKKNDWRMAFGSSLYYAGNTREEKTDLGFMAFEASLDFAHPTSWTLNGQTMYLGGYATIFSFSNLEFVQLDQSVFEVNKQYEIGIALRTEKSIELFGSEFNRIGLGYRFGEDFTAWKIVFSLPY
jgi:hypothetical protein